MYGLLIIAALVAYWISIKQSAARKQKQFRLPADADEILNDRVSFYRRLSAEDQQVFRDRVRDFLAETTVRGVGTDIDDTDRLLVAAGAIIPIFSFPDWRYNNISEVLIYADAFTKDFRATGDNRNVAGMVGDGAMNRQMILSRKALQSAFRHNEGDNTVIHEFVHLLDKADGSVDGVPEYLLSQPAVIPWVRMMEDNILEIRGRNPNKIDPYAGLNEAEFFAVISEYFFERPDKLQEDAPELYAMLESMFRPDKTNGRK